MKKIIAIISAALFPAVSFAQNYGYRMMGNYGESAPSGFWIFLFFLLPVVWFAIMVGLFVFWLSMLIDAIKHAPEKMKLIWVIVIIFTNVIGALIYYFVEKKHKGRHKAE